VVVMIDRSSKESREKSVGLLKEEIENGQSVLIFPEGTMNKTSAPLGDFYDGAFRIAIETQTPLMPFVMINNSKLLPRIAPLKVRPGIIKTVFLGEISVKGLDLEDLPLLKQKVYAMMEQALIKFN
jgi:1-acyl-sn-glycerol-3-phosphate acyltransferase